MASGIVSTAWRDNGMPGLSRFLLLLGVAGYIALVLITAWRLLRWPRRLLADLVGPRAFAFLTFVAASNVLGSGLAAEGRPWAATVLFAVGLVAWLVLGYGIPLGLIADRHRHADVDDVNGTWFVWVVATQSIAVTAVALVPHTGGFGHALAALAAICWAIGLVLYVLLAALGFARLLLRPVSSTDLVPAYWVFMGSAAITVLAGARLLSLPTADQLLSHEVITGSSMVLWSFCTWLIPLLIALGVWRHVVRRVSLRYETGLWSVVFPVGMYGVASHQLGSATDTTWLAVLGRDEAWVALAAWLAVFLAMVVAAGQTLRRPGVVPE